MLIKKRGLAQYSHLVWLFPLAILLRLGFAFFDVGIGETVLSNIPLAINSAKNVFGIYAQTEGFVFTSPPLIAVLFSLFGGAIESATDVNIQLYLVKIIPCILDAALVPILFKMLVELNAKNLLLLPFFWAVNPCAIFNCSVLGQTDSVLLVFIALLFYSMLRKNPYLVCISFAFGCLTSTHMIYLLPALVFYLIFECEGISLANRVASFISGLLIIFLSWMPFMSLGGGLKLPFKIYFPNFESIAAKTPNTTNIYAFFSPFSQGTDVSAINTPLLKQISDIMMIILAIIVALGILFCLIKRVSLPTCVVALVFLFSVFLFTVNGKASFLLTSILLAVMCYISTQKTGYFVLSIALSITSLFSQWASALNAMHKASFINSQFMMQVLSSINIIFYLILLFLFICEILRSVKRSKIMC